MATDKPMQLGMIGLGRMGANLVRRLMRDGHSCVVFDVSTNAVAELVGEGATGADSPGTSSRNWTSHGPYGSCFRPRSSTPSSASSSRCWSPVTS